LRARSEDWNIRPPSNLNVLVPSSLDDSSEASTTNLPVSKEDSITSSGQARTVMPHSNTIYAVDLFCGAGGLTKGFLEGGVQVVAGFDSDPECRYPYEVNNKTRFVDADVSRVSGKQVARMFPASGVKLLAGCAPCQPFSPLGRTGVGKQRADRKLQLHFARLIREVRPHIVVMENVTNVRTRAEYAFFESTLRKLGYTISIHEINAHKYGVPQSRKRLVVLASVFGPPELITPTPEPNGRPFVEDAICR
jgi:DNA (cytosine-5)-methyltransferase 1